MDPRALAHTALARLPRPALVSLVVILGGLMVQQAWAWRTGVDEHIERSVDVDNRLAVVERIAADLRDEIRGLRQEQQQQRLDQLNFYRWLAEHQFGDSAKGRELEAKARSLQREP